ncbi:MAG: hypothetical protein ACLQM8_06815 [Limisphaerales bacterium]
MKTEGQFALRWRGRRYGPLAVSEIEDKLATGEIGLAHEILHEGGWVTLRDYLAERDALRRAESQAKEEQRRKSAEEEERARRQRHPQVHASVTRTPDPRQPRGVFSICSVIDIVLARKVVSAMMVVAGLALSIWVALRLVPKIPDTLRRSSPTAQQAVKVAWMEVQQAEAHSFSADKQNPNAFFQNRAFLFTQVDCSNTDPALEDYVRRTVETSKELAGIFWDIEKESQEAETGRQEIARWIELFGQLCGAVARNDRPVSDNIQLGQFAGQLAGWATTGFLSNISNDDIRRKYGDRLKAAGNQYEQLFRQRSTLAQSLSTKYNLQLLDAF